VIGHIEVSCKQCSPLGDTGEVLSERLAGMGEKRSRVHISIFGFTDFQRCTDSKMPFAALNVGETYDTGDEPASGRVQSAVGPEISSWMGYDFMVVRIGSSKGHSEQVAARREDGKIHALDLHFGPGEAGEVAPGAEVDGHGSSFCWFEFNPGWPMLAA
jgi:hypothetical protein